MTSTFSSSASDAMEPGRFIADPTSLITLNLSTADLADPDGDGSQAASRRLWHEILHMLGQPMSDQIWAALHEDRPYDLARHVAALRALPGSWELERAARSSRERHESGRRQVRQDARAARRRNRRPK
jgi:hypothetical protein